MTGRKTGKKRSSPLIYIPNSELRQIIVVDLVASVLLFGAGVASYIASAPGS